MAFRGAPTVDDTAGFQWLEIQDRGIETRDEGLVLAEIKQLHYTISNGVSKKSGYPAIEESDQLRPSNALNCHSVVDNRHSL
jgi:hypothetical protein